VSFHVDKGETVGLIGPNGAGKTTLVDVVTGSTRPTSGDIILRGRSLRRLRPHRASSLGVARTFQIARPFTGMTVAENVMVGALHGRARDRVRDARARAVALVDAVGLAEKVDAAAESLSVPERKRLEIARALSAEPELLLLDEVMAGLTPTEVDATVELVRAMRERGLTILIVEHVMRAIESLADRVIVLHHGEKLFEGTPAQAFADKAVIRAYLGGRRRREAR
jgi:branched-chain amino acid transport system ATP-binding protein